MTDKPKRPNTWPKGVSGNPAGRKKGAELVNQLLKPHAKELVIKAKNMALAGDTTALRICIDRIAPPPRNESAPVVIPGIDQANTMSEKAACIVSAMGNAQIGPDTAAMLLGAIASAAKIIETDELAARISALENHA